MLNKCYNKLWPCGHSRLVSVFQTAPMIRSCSTCLQMMEIDVRRWRRGGVKEREEVNGTPPSSVWVSEIQAVGSSSRVVPFRPFTCGILHTGTVLSFGWTAVVLWIPVIPKMFVSCGNVSTTTSKCPSPVFTWYYLFVLFWIFTMFIWESTKNDNDMKQIQNKHGITFRWRMCH